MSSVMYTDPPQIVWMASRRTGSFGAARLGELTAAALDEMYDSAVEAREALARHADAEFLSDDWFWLPGERRYRLADLGRRILAVAGPLDVATVRAGVVRTYTRAQVAFVPPENVVAAFFRAHPDFSVDAAGGVHPVVELDYRAELGKTDLIFVETLRASWTGVLDRPSFLEACVARGMSARTFALRAPRSAVLDDPGGDIWCLRGTRVSPITAAALRHAKVLTDG